MQRQAGIDSRECSECPAVFLDEFLESEQGRLIVQVLDLDFALGIGLKLSLSDISYAEFRLLRILNEERHRYNAEQDEKRNHGRQ